jgi:hypothetical protein
VTATAASRSGLAVAALLALAGVARAEAVLLLPASGAGVSAAIIQSARAHFAARLAEREPALRVVLASGEPTATPVPSLVAVETAGQAHADLAVVFDLRRSEGTTVLAVSGQPVHAVAALFAFTSTTTGGPDLLPAMVDRAVSVALAARAERGGVPRPRPALGVGVRAGLQAPFGTPGKVSALLPGAGLFVMKYFQYGFADLGFAYAGLEDAHAFSFGMGGYAALQPADDTVYLGAALRWQANRLGGQGASGFAVAPGAGLAWRRPLGLSFRVEADARVDLFQENEQDRLIPGTGRSHRAVAVEIWMGAWL